MTKKITDEVAYVELTEEQMLEMRLDEIIGPPIEEALDLDPFFYRPFKDKTAEELIFESEKCDAACVFSKIKSETPNPAINATRKDLNREQGIRSGLFLPTTKS